VKSYEVVRGDIADLASADNLLVIGPFWGVEDEHHLCIAGEGKAFPSESEIIFINKYNDAQRFAEGFRKSGLFNTELYLEVYYDELEKTSKRLRELSGNEIKDALDLDRQPDLILFGRLKKRDHKIAPLSQVFIDAEYELEFYNPNLHRSTITDAAVFEPFEEDIESIVRETGNLIATLGAR
jgi:hypothetical protein